MSHGGITHKTEERTAAMPLAAAHPCCALFCQRPLLKCHVVKTLHKRYTPSDSERYRPLYIYGNGTIMNPLKRYIRREYSAQQRQCQSKML